MLKLTLLGSLAIAANDFLKSCDVRRQSAPGRRQLVYRTKALRFLRVYCSGVKLVVRYDYSVNLSYVRVRGRLRELTGGAHPTDCDMLERPRRKFSLPP